MKHRRFAIELLFVLLPLRHFFVPVLSSSSNSTLLLRDLLKEISAKAGTRTTSRSPDWTLRGSGSEFLTGVSSESDSAPLAFRRFSPTSFRRGRRLETPEAISLRFSTKLVLSPCSTRSKLKVPSSFECSSATATVPLCYCRTLTGFKRILVGKGITVEVRGAQGVSAFQASDLDSTGKSSNVTVNEKTEFWTIQNSFCRSLPLVQVNGSASFVAYRTRNPNHLIETNRISKEMIELLAEKCYGSNGYKNRDCPVESLSLRIPQIEKVLKSYFGEQLDGFVGLFRGKIIASAIVRFQLELERSNAAQETYVGWRTRTNIRRVWFDVFAIVEDRSLKLLMAKKTKPPFIADSALWSDLTNISLTQLPSLLAPSEALTLDVKW